MKPGRIAVAAALATTWLAPFAIAQTTPFDMSPERPKGAAPASPSVQPAPAPAPATQPPIPPFTPVPATAKPPATPVAPAPPKSAGATPAGKPVTTERFRRFLVPASDLGLNGEIDKKTWSIYLTPAQAAASVKLNLAYQNAIVVAPEASQLTVLINSRSVGSTPIRSAEKPEELSFDVPAGLLQAGSNLVSFETQQRHRTDCSISSTYELWTDIDPSRTYLSFGGTDAARLVSTDGVRAVGVDEKGATEFDFVVPGLSQPGTTKPLMRLAQGLSVLSGMPNQSFNFQTAGLPALAPGKLTVLVGTASELQPLFPALPQAAQLAPMAAFVNDPRSGGPVLLVTGPSWQSMDTAIDSLVTSTDRAVDNRRDVLATQRWQAPDVPLIFSNTVLPFSQLGVATTQFTGRRFRTDFGIGVPADFYANAYGEATILLDAAYSPDVLPGSHIDVFVNGSVASTVPITNKGGGIFRHLPIRVTLRHFKPGLNHIAVEAALLTSTDAACAPGSNSSATPHFALFDTSEFRMPDFARVGQRPNLAATGGTGYPYGLIENVLPVYLDRVDADTLSASATFLARLALMAGRPIPIEVATSPAGIGDRNALFIGPISQIPPTALTQLNIAPASQVSWRPNTAGKPADVDTGATFEQWRSMVSGGSWTGQISAFEDWMRRNFDISFSSLRFAPSAEATFMPSNAATIMVAQGASPDGNGTWTIVTSPTASDLRSGLMALSAEDTWPELSGRVTTYAAATKKIETVPVARFAFVPTQDFSFSNYRLVAANWLSTNILSYALLFAALTMLMGLATAALLSNLGRRR
ncbi:cellulose biosynthesis cyclic di-GMP-binding regulatory protein BcsB [Rhizobium tumorigenes]|uniref:Cyclic di-GMP-binding protein n=1 Tax=Rhizobium tumorigenes TaxID=2041385 RepID=A0AAF1KQV1_9HYPH|nr:cellulose biosynthesis cyclic di-GMP-binding regulatory protein BcsB [Rhizobium tumorigenes]WFR95528.1 cellulose biosynthesis cyclic di-GMP-binding regulatory protein BcsB [Rhizobium tumorigenes]